LNIDPDGTKSGSGMFMSADPVPLLDIDGSPDAHLGGVNDGNSTFWMNANDGSGGFAKGAGRLNENGVELNGAGRYLTQMATIGDNTRVGRIGMVDDGSGVPTWLLDYFDPNDVGNINLLADMNCGFETGDMTDWEVGVQSYLGYVEAQNEIAYSGDYAAKFTLAPLRRSANIISGVVEVEGGKDYVMSGMFCSTDIQGNAYVQIWFYSDVGGTENIGMQYLAIDNPPIDFTKYQMVVEAPAEALSARITIIFGNDNTSSVFYADDISLVKIPEGNISKIALVDGGIKITGSLNAGNDLNTGNITATGSITATGNIAASRIKGTKALGARVIRTSTQSLSAATWTELSWDRETDTCDHSGNQSDDTSDSDNIWTSGNPTRLYCREDGWYTAGGGYEVQANSSAIMRRGIQVKLYNSGGTLHGILARNQTMDASGSSAYLSIAIQTGHFYMHSGDYITVEAETGAARTIQAATTTEHYHNFGFLTRVS